MRHWISATAVTSAVVGCALAWGGCSSSSSPSGGSGNDASASSSSGGGSGGSSSGSEGGASSSSSGGGSGTSINCPTSPCPSGQQCCADLANNTPTCMTSCPGDTLGCLGPMDCSGTTPDCCATDVLNGMDAGAAFPHCYSQTLTTKCVAKASCSSNITVNCGTAQMPQTETLHVCTAKTDCTGDDMSNPNCCLVDNYHVCVSSLLVTLGALSCL